MVDIAFTLVFKSPMYSIRFLYFIPTSGSSFLIIQIMGVSGDDLIQ